MPTVPPVPPSIPTAWAQQPEERGKLPVGRVVAIERWSGPAAQVRSQESNIASELAAVYVGIPLVFIAAPFILMSYAAGGDTWDEKPSKTNGNVYRHVVQLIGTNEEIIRDEYWTYKVGDCVAVRSQPVLLVPAFPDQCE